MSFPLIDVQDSVENALSYIEDAQDHLFEVYFQHGDTPGFAMKWDKFLTAAKDGLRGLLDDPEFMEGFRGEAQEYDRQADMADAQNY